MYKKKHLIIMILTSLFILSLILNSYNLFDNRKDGEATSLPFMFNVDEVGHRQILGNDFAIELKNGLNENMDWTAPPYFWSEIEPVDNQFNWNELDDFLSNNKNKYRVINMGPGFIPTGDGDFSMVGDIPSWIENKYSNPQLKEQYRELLQAIVSRYKDDIYMWWIGFEVNLGGDVDAFSWEMWKKWVGLQVSWMRVIDPDAKIAISFGSWTDCHEQMPPNAIHEGDGTRELINEGVDFDVIAIEYHYGTLQNGDIDNFRQALTNLKSVGKEIFIWEVFYPGGTDPKYQDYWSWEFPPDEGYTEEWQANQLYETLKLAFEDAKIIGINMFHFQEITYEEIDPTDREAGWRCYAGLVRVDGTPKEAYFKIRDYWKMISDR
jgi:hypothetical protein